MFRILVKLLQSKDLYLTKSLTFRGRQQVLPPNFDYVRFAMLGLISEEIEFNNIKGNVAELGVYKGDFAYRINQTFSKRKLYLFDTFEGFDERDISTERKMGYSTGDQDFSNTSVELVLQKMPFRNQCIVKKGFFPATAEGMNDTFCFVSIDTDLFDSILEGLQFFYPRLEKGGYIFIHDFNNDFYKGAREAVLQFCTSQGIAYIPIPDSGGTVILSK